MSSKKECPKCGSEIVEAADWPDDWVVCLDCLYAGKADELEEERISKKNLQDGNGSRMRVKTGIPSMDDLIAGGIPEGNMVLVSGDYGTGKTTFALQFLSRGVEDYGDFGVFVTFADDLNTVLEIGKGFGWGLKKWRKAGSLKLLGGAPDRVQDFSEDAQGSGKDLVDEILEAVEEMEAERMAIDGLAEFSEFFKNRRDFNLNLARLRRELKDRECTSVVTSPLDYGVERTVDGVIVLHYDGQVEKTRALEVRKMRKSSHTDRLCPFEITDMGIVVTGPPKES